MYAYLFTLKEVFNDPEKVVILDPEKAKQFFIDNVNLAFTENEVNKDDDNRTPEECWRAGIMNCDPYTITMEVINVIDYERRPEK